MMKANFPVRLVGSVVSAEDARVAAGIAGDGGKSGCWGGGTSCLWQRAR